MQIIQWLFKVTRENTKAISTAGSSKRELKAKEEEPKSNDVVVFNRGRSSQRRQEQFRCGEGEAESKKTFTILLAGEDSNNIFYRTLNLKHLRNYYQNQHFRDVVEEEDYTKSGMGHKVDSNHVGCKVLPISNASLIRPNCSENGDDSEKNMNHGERRRVVSRMRELMRWAASSKTSKGNKDWKVMYFSRKGALKAPKDEFSSHSSKISFKWDVGPHNTQHPPLSLPSRNDPMWMKHLFNPALNTPSLECKGMDTLVSPTAKECERKVNWITTDSDFVVLEF